MSIKPFSPEDVIARAADPENFPREVIQVVNGLLKERGFANKQIIFTQDEVLDRLEQLFEEKNLAFDRQEAFDRHWLDFEAAYRARGWNVVYDKPGYNENYKAHWVFTVSS